jgi:hypothetical protein
MVRQGQTSELREDRRFMLKWQQPELVVVKRGEILAMPGYRGGWNGQATDWIASHSSKYFQRIKEST